MNAPIRSERLLPAAVEIIKRVPFLPDEPTFSYVNRVACLTAAISRKQVVAMLFGSPRIRPESPLHCGFGHHAALHADAYGTMPTDLTQRFGMLSLYAPFVEIGRYRHAQTLLHGERGTGINEIVGTRSSGVFRGTPAFCVACLMEDLARARPSHYRRTLQVSAVACCPDHGTALITHCADCGTPLSHDQNPGFSCHICGKSYKCNEPLSKPSSDTTPKWRLAKFIHAAMVGKLPFVDLHIRTEVMCLSAAQIVNSRCKVVGSNLARVVSNTYGREFLNELGLPVHAAPTLGWPALLLHGRSLTNDPLANCLILAALFNSVEDYLDSVAKVKLKDTPTPLPRKSLVGVKWITFGVLKDVLRPLRLIDVAKKHRINPDTLADWVAAVPGLSERRLSSGARVTLRAYKKTILRYVNEHPKHSRTQAAEKHKTEIAYLLKVDRAWLNQYLPRRDNLSGFVCRAPIGQSISDDALVARIRASVTAEKSSMARPRRLSFDRVFRMSGLAGESDEFRTGFPKAMVAVTDCTESIEEFYQRSLLWAARDLKRCYGSCQNVIQLFVHARVGIQYIERLDEYAQRLMGDYEIKAKYRD